MSKVDYYKAEYHRTLRDLTKNPSVWKSFLSSAAYQYKYTFRDQIMIYAQRPTAIACAEYDVWSKNLGRWVKRGAQGIALLQFRGGKSTLRYVFDSRDTRNAENEELTIWSVAKEHEKEVIGALEERFGTLVNTDHLAEALLSTCANAVEDNLTDYVSELVDSSENSFLDDLDEDNLRVRLRRTVRESVIFSVMTRLGYDVNEYLDSDAFEWVHEFNTPACINILGSATSEISELCLREIERTVKLAEKNRTFDGKENRIYNKSEEKQEIKENGGNENDKTHLQNGERRTDSESEIAEAEKLSPWEVRHDASRLLGETPQGNVHDTSDGISSGGTPLRNRTESERADHEDHGGDGTELGRERTDESERSHEVGADDEQHQENGGGYRLAGVDLHLKGKTLPECDEQTVIEILRHGEYLQQSKENIVSFFHAEPDDEKKAEYLKSIFPKETYCGFYRKGTQEYIGYRTYDKYLDLIDGSGLNPRARTELPWLMIAKMMDALIRTGQYLDEKPKPIIAETPKKSYPQFDISQEIIDNFLRLGGCVKNSTQRIYSFYRRCDDVQSRISFLKKEYESDSVGIMVGDRKAAAKWDENGVWIAEGETAERRDAIFLSWEDVDKRIMQLLEKGQYIGNFEASRADEIWEDHVGDRFTWLYRDYFESFPDEYKTFNTGGGWDDRKKYYVELLKHEELRGKLFDEIQRNLKRTSEFPPRFRYVYTPEYTVMIGKTLAHDPIIYPEADESLLPPKHYVSEDKITSYLVGRSSGVREGKYRIYSFFLQHSDLQERAKFLSHEYGIGGSYGGRTYVDHNGKGLMLGGGLHRPSEGILLKWTQVAKRTGELIAQNRYLNKEEIDGLDGYEKRQIALAIRHFFIDRSEECPRPYQAKGEVFSGEKIDKELLPQLDDKERVKEIVDMMQAAFDMEMPENRWYDHHKEQLETVKSFSRGEYNLFPNSYYRRTPSVSLSEKYRQQTAEKEEANTSLISEIPESEYDLRLGTHVYIGKDGCDITSISKDMVELFDGTLIPLELSYEVFMRRLRENPLNDHLKKTMEEAKEDVAEVIEVEAVEVSTEEVREEQAELVEDIAEPTENDIADELSEMDRAKALIDEFFDREYNASIEDSDNMSEIGLAYTKIGDEEYEIQVNVNLEEYRVERYLDGKLFDSMQFESLAELNDSFLSDLSFDDLVYVDDDELSRFLEDEGRKMPVPVVKDEQKETPIYEIAPTELAGEKRNYRITDDALGIGGPKEKFRRNMAAINLLHTLEGENRLATPAEQEVLAQYTGWGGLSDAFDVSRTNWSQEYEELRSSLTPEEYEAARESTLTAFYTPPIVIKAMYDALGNMGFKRGNILEPSCGVGNFIGLLPETMNESKVYGVELDSISGRIARQLYQKESITVNGYEKTQFPDSFFDVAIGNVPFGQFKVMDRKYDKYNFLIHDFFFAKTLDKVRPGGVVAFITSSGTLDKVSPAVRKYLAERADLIGAIRLPDDTFKDNAGTRVVSDIIFLQKRDRVIEREADWIHLATNEDGITMNQYFVDHPDMVLGDMVMRSGPFGEEPTCRAKDGVDLADALKDAVAKIHAEIQDVERDELTEEKNDTIPADPRVKNYSYTLVDGKIYYRHNSIMRPVETSAVGANRIKGMIAIRDTVRALIDAQLSGDGDSKILALQEKLNRLYDAFTEKYGLLNSRGNALAFSDDDSYFLLCSLEILDENKELKAKADMFTKRTIKPQIVIDHVDTASEALALSLGEKAMVDMEYMAKLTGKSEEELYGDLKGVVFLNPYYGNRVGARKYLPADEYLSGNVREKLDVARKTAELYPDDYAVNVEALERVQPKDLTAAEIGVKLGSTWVPTEDIEAFVHELLGTSYYARRKIKVKYIPHTAQWVISEKNYERGSVKVNSTFGTTRINAYEIIEETLNLKDVRIVDYFMDADGNKRAVLNKKETTIAQGKQEQIKRAFEEWIWKDPERRERLCKLYNEKFNSFRPREFDGSHIKFYGMNPEITLRQHQANAVARIMYGGNSLLAHVVGAGKTFTMVAASQEMKRLGLCSKSMFVVPNHLIEQWASEYLQLYPSANILVATKKDFETKNRKRFCARIATGDYDAIIIGHSQFEKIPVSAERQKQTLQAEIDEIMESMESLSEDRGERITVKKLAQAKKQLETKLEKLNDQSRKDDVVTFEELGIDRLFVDEAHYYKNLAAYSKMRNVAGISQTEAQKSSDMYMKTRYLDELTGGKGCIFATGTPISNTMVELYTMQKYLQYNTMKSNNLLNFDAWASTFGETVTAIELAPDGSGYRTKTRFAKFFNIPELMAMYRQFADVQTADMLKLPVPDAVYHIEQVEASDIQKKLVESFVERAEKIHSGAVKSDVDNMLLVTNDGRKTALDQRLINPLLPDFEGSKVNKCVDNVYDIWERTAEKRSAQMIFCDLSTPKNDGSFNVYDDIRNKLIARGVPSDEIAFIHTADTDAKKKELFAKVRNGQVRVLIGSTLKMGAGTNVQKRLIALHDLDVPWRPADLEQRAGRIVRQGNENPEVHIYRYITKGTFDAYSYQLLETKQKFISQIQTSKSPVRSAEDVDDMALSYAEMKAVASGNPKIMEKMTLDNEVAKLKLQKSSHLTQRYALEDKLIKDYPRAIAEVSARIRDLESDMQMVKEQTTPGEKGFSPMVILGTTYTEKVEAGKAILKVCSRIASQDSRPLGEYRGFHMEVGFDGLSREFYISLRGKMTHRVNLGTDAGGIITRIDNQIENIPKRKESNEEQLAELQKQIEIAKAEIEKPFPYEDELNAMCKRLDELNAELNLDKRENELVDDAEEQGAPSKEKKEVEREDR